MCRSAGVAVCAGVLDEPLRGGGLADAPQTWLRDGEPRECLCLRLPGLKGYRNINSN